jgi:hypothetical protein
MYECAACSHNRTRADSLAGELDAANANGTHALAAIMDLTINKIPAIEHERDSLAGELATLRAAYEGLREAARDWHVGAFGEEPFGALATSLAATPASLAGKVRARILREAAAAVADTESPYWSPDAAKQLLSLAEESER